MSHEETTLDILLIHCSTCDLKVATQPSMLISFIQRMREKEKGN